jgi:heptosyltransferase III
MSFLLDRLPSGARICVIRLRSLGDCVLTTPALALLKVHRPDLKISVVVEPRFAGVFEDNPDIHSIDVNVIPADLVLNLHGGTRSMWMTAKSFARYRVGFGHHRYSFVYSHKIPRAQEILGEKRPVHTAEHLASAVFWLGVPQTKIPRAKLFAPPSYHTHPFAVIHPYASALDKAWPVDRFVQIAHRVRTEFGLEPHIVAGPADDTAPFSEFDVLRNARLSDVKSLMSGAALFIGNDSGPAHIAAAFGVPVVVLFGPSNPVTWAPWRTESQVLTSSGAISEISTEEVFSAAGTLRHAGNPSPLTKVAQ